MEGQEWEGEETQLEFELKEKEEASGEAVKEEGVEDNTEVSVIEEWGWDREWDREWESKWVEAKGEEAAEQQSLDVFPFSNEENEMLALEKCAGGEGDSDELVETEAEAEAAEEEGEE